MKTLSLFIFFVFAGTAWGQVRVNSMIDGGQREPSIAVTPTGNIFIGYINTVDGTVHLNRSTNGGTTWVELTPGIPGADPTLAADSSGRLYFAFLNDTVKIVRTDNQGLSFPLVNQALTPSGSDRPWIKIGPADAVYLTYAGYSFPPDTCSVSAYKSDIYFKKSLDLGATWHPTPQEPQTILTAPIASNNYRCSSGPIAVGPNGEIYVLLNCFVFDLSNNCAALTIQEHHVYLTRSDDGGNTFPLANFRELPNVNPIENQAGYAAFSTANKRMNMASIAVLPPNPPSPGSPGVVGIVWPCDSGEDFDICFQASADKGVSFPFLNKVNSDAVKAYRFFPAIVADMTGFHVIWMDSRETGLDTSNPKWAAYRADGLSTWTNQTMVSSVAAPGNDINSDEGGVPDPQGFGDFFEITSRNNNVYSTWSDTSLGTADIYFGR
ncbi:MAG: hypothetical protein HY282_18210 [Nitrospirae bacterium]|nr:hypothetical protein [Candidatus Manganitrophaceae bacterium]